MSRRDLLSYLLLEEIEGEELLIEQLLIAEEGNSNEHVTLIFFCFNYFFFLTKGI